MSLRRQGFDNRIGSTTSNKYRKKGPRFSNICRWLWMKWHVEEKSHMAWNHLLGFHLYIFAVQRSKGKLMELSAHRQNNRLPSFFFLPFFLFVISWFTSGIKVPHIGSSWVNEVFLIWFKCYRLYGIPRLYVKETRRIAILHARTHTWTLTRWKRFAK